jgi:hypothetical protein
LHDGTVRDDHGQRDGMFLELWDGPSNELALWAFFSDADGSFEVTRYRADVPPKVEAWFQAEARRRFPPCGRVTSRDRVLLILLQHISKITVTGALHDCLRYGEPHVGTKTFCMEEIRVSKNPSSGAPTSL